MDINEALSVAREYERSQFSRLHQALVVLADAVVDMRHAAREEKDVKSQIFSAMSAKGEL